MFFYVGYNVLGSNFDNTWTGANPGLEKGRAHQSRVAKSRKLIIFMTYLINVRSNL